MVQLERRELVNLLIEDPSPTTRSRAHLELGRRARGRADLDKARVHFEEAVALDPTDERPQRALAALDEQSATPAPVGLLGWLLGRRRTEPRVA